MLYDKDIREPLFDFLEETYGKIRIIEEKQMGRSRADVVMVMPSALCGIEIKSDADTYARLSRQVRDYNQYYDYNYIVAGTSHAGHIAEHVPEWWGIITVELQDGIPDFYLLREPKENPKVNWSHKMSLLWRPELAHIQELNQLPKYKEKSKSFVIEKILLKVEKEQLKEQISGELFERDYNEIEETIRKYKKDKLLKKFDR
ncbi:sce7726 family protein [Roseburia sp. 499]|uniref:sce7726 family protein n=1 Tax=Roseburia sp. 499 TaxID=1261634 RepID=UPI0009517B4D|nr:sce7726 family protein [Roseburia sp. 499]WVK68841.1 sce7726 family protein [Roseburia sp. 499]